MSSDKGFPQRTWQCGNPWSVDMFPVENLRPANVYYRKPQIPLHIPCGKPLSCWRVRCGKPPSADIFPKEITVSMTCSLWETFSRDAENLHSWKTCTYDHSSSDTQRRSWRYSHRSRSSCLLWMASMLLGSTLHQHMNTVPQRRSSIRHPMENLRLVHIILWKTSIRRTVTFVYIWVPVLFSTKYYHILSYIYIYI